MTITGLDLCSSFYSLTVFDDDNFGGDEDDDEFDFDDDNFGGDEDDDEL